ncbi:hypothetical protein GALL_392720 [mine drainage metagenome]|uniref:Protein phosphatase CheZ n=1 Tax=mine drainage metagenome TaxID=410659 RepID=A0A1J5QGB6_9ZZZZ
MDRAMLANVEALRRLREADALLAEGMRRISGAVVDIHGASRPLEEALRLSEQQAMVTLDAAEAAQRELQAIEAAARRGGYIDAALAAIDRRLQCIVDGQQAQDLAGQRLLKTIALLQAVEQRIREALSQLGCASPEPRHALAAAVPAESAHGLDQQSVDALFAELGI